MCGAPSSLEPIRDINESTVKIIKGLKFKCIRSTRKADCDRDKTYSYDKYRDHLLSHELEDSEDSESEDEKNGIIQPREAVKEYL